MKFVKISEHWINPEHVICISIVRDRGSNIFLVNGKVIWTNLRPYEVLEKFEEDH